MSLPAAPRPVLIAHRGASGYRPEHTAASYELAARMGADYLEPDLVPTRDGHLVVRHENEVSGTTDIADRPEFADRRRTREVDGVSVTGWFTEDLTLAELRTLRSRERLPQLRPDSATHDGVHPVLTLEDLLDLRETLADERGTELGVYLETKHPTYFRGIGLPLEEPLVAALEAAGLNRPDAPVFLQSFERGNLALLREELGARVPLVFLADARGAPFDLVAAGDGRRTADLLTPRGLADLAGFVDGIGPHKDLVLGRTPDGGLGEPTSLVADAHAVGLVVHPWTFRAENAFLPTDLRSGPEPAAHGDVVAEMRAHLAAGVDGIFTDHADLGVQALAPPG